MTKAIAPTLTADEIAMLRAAPHRLGVWSNVAQGDGQIIINLTRFGYLERTTVLLGRDPLGQADVTTYDITPAGKYILEAIDA